MARLSSQADPLPFFILGDFTIQSIRLRRSMTGYNNCLGLFGRYTISTWAVTLGTRHHARTAVEETGEGTGSDMSTRWTVCQGDIGISLLLGLNVYR